MSISPAQKRAFRGFVVAALEGYIDHDFVVWSFNDHPIAGPKWCALRPIAEPEIGGGSELVDFSLRSKHRIEFSADVASTITITTPDASPPIVSTAGPVGSPAPDVLALRDLHVAQLVGSPLWVASSADPNAIEIEATEAGRGVLLEVAATPSASLVVSLVRDCYAEGVRDLLEPSISVQVFSKLDDENPALEDAADVLLGRVRARFFASVAAAGMRAAGLAPIRRGTVTDLSGLRGASQWETRAALDLTFRRASVILEQPGTIETIEGTGTLQPGNLTVPFQASKT